VVEGVRRAEVWNRICTFIHRNSYFEPTDAKIDEKLTWEDVRMAKKVYTFLDGSTPVGAIVEKLPFSRYKVYRAVSELLDKKMIVPADVTAAVDREKRIQRLIADSRDATTQGRYTQAMDILRGLADSNPGRKEILDDLEKVTNEFRHSIYEHNFTLQDVPVLMVGPDAIPQMNLDPSDAFMMSRIDGRLSVREILKITPVSEFDGLRSFKRLMNAKVIDFPHRKAV
jgi:hypothetical protein